jgi:aryl-alcohol dehydrogenase-like predicted oxidoreductase
VPFAESIGALAELYEAGKVRMVGVSNVTVAQIDEACAIAPVVSVQNEFSPRFRTSADELAHCQQLGLAFLAWSPLGGMRSAADIGALHEAFARVAEAHGASPHQVALAWELAQAECVIPIPGSSRPETITDSVAAADLELTADELELLNGAR